jgi:DNA replication protein DnaC
MSTRRRSPPAKQRSARRKADGADRGRPVDAPVSDDLLEHLYRHFDRLGLHELRERITEHLAWAQAQEADRLTLLERVFGEAAGRKRERVIERRIKHSGLRARKTLEAFDWAFQPKLDRAFVLELASLRFVERGDDVLITGKPGTGKSHILQAFTLRACEKEIYVRYARCVDLLDDLHAGLGDGSYEQRLRRWTQPELLVVDDVGLGQLKKRDDEPTAAHSLYNLLDRRHEDRRPTAMSSNLRLSQWGRYLGDVALTAAILDRLAMHAIRLDIDGPSYRQYVARQRAREQGREVEDEAAQD